MTKFSALAEILHQEHVTTITALNALEERILGHDKNKPINALSAGGQAELQALLDVIDREINQHFRFEEEHLFPALTNRGYGELATLLEQEHDAIRSLSASLEKVTVAALAQDFDRESWQAYREAGMDLIPSVMFHIQKEETAVIERLSFFLAAETDRALAEEYSRDKKTWKGDNRLIDR
jgi:iron-sulfur cluster repair protein YtfE (RIC family)